jgi:predicted transcriptional regulator
MEVTFSPETEAKVNNAAVANESSPAEYVQQLVESYVDHDAWFRGRVKEGIEQLDRGEFISHESVKANIEKLLRG